MAMTDLQGRARLDAPAFSRPSRHINRMAMFVTIVGGVALLLYQGLAAAFMANAALNGVILALLLIGIVFAFRSVLRLGREIDWLTWYQTYISHPRPQMTTPPRPNLLAPMARMLGDRPRRLSLSAMSLRSLLDGIDARLSEGRELSRYLIGLLIFLGLLGTFWGLLQTVGAVSDVIGDLSVDRGELAIVFAELQAGLEAPLGGMGTAFSSSLFGLAGSLVLGFLELQANQAQSRFYNELEDWLSGNVRLTAGAQSADGETGGSVNAYVAALLDNTAETIDKLEVTVARTEESRRREATNLGTLIDNLAALVDRMEHQQTQMTRLAETTGDLSTAVNKLVQTANDGRFGLDAPSRDHLRTIDAKLAQLVAETTEGRERLIGEMHTEFKLLARTIAVATEDPATIAAAAGQPPPTGGR